VEIPPIAETSKSNNTSAADEIDLNSDDGELFKDQLIDSTAKLELRTEPDDIFEDIPEIKESRNDSVNIPPVFEPAPRVQVKPITFKLNHTHYILLFHPVTELIILCPILIFLLQNFQNNSHGEASAASENSAVAQPSSNEVYFKKQTSSYLHKFACIIQNTLCFSFRQVTSLLKSL
jgi:hypothetical protein